VTNLCTTNEGSDAQLLRADFSRIDDCQLEALGGDLTELAADHEQAVALGHQCIGNAIVAAEVDATFMSITPWRIATNSRVWSPPRAGSPKSCSPCAISSGTSTSTGPGRPQVATAKARRPPDVISSPIAGLHRSATVFREASAHNCFVSADRTALAPSRCLRTSSSSTTPRMVREWRS